MYNIHTKILYSILLYKTSVNKNIIFTKFVKEPKNIKTPMLIHMGVLKIIIIAK